MAGVADGGEAVGKRGDPVSVTRQRPGSWQAGSVGALEEVPHDLPVPGLDDGP